MSDLNMPKEMEDLCRNLNLIDDGVLRKGKEPEPEPELADTVPEVDITKLPALPHGALVHGECGVPKDFITPDCAWYMYHAWAKTSRAVVMQVGAPGTGKTTTTYDVVRRWPEISPCGRRAAVLHYNCKADDTPSSIIGTVGVRTVNGGFEDYLRHGPLYLAAKLQNENPDLQIVIYFNEANYWAPAVQTVLNSVGDDVQAFYSNVTGERIETRGLRIVLDMNANLAGTRQVQEALKDRFHTVKFDYLKEEDEIKILLSRTKITRSMAQRMVKCLNVFRAAANGKKAMSVPMKFDASPRLALDAAECMEHGMSPDRAWQEACYGRAGYEKVYVGLRETLRSLSKTSNFTLEVV